MTKSRVCSISDCGKPSYGRRLCPMHRERLRRLGTTDLPIRVPQVCRIEGCGKAHRSRGLCQTHYRRWQSHGDAHWLPPAKGTTCTIEGCDRPFLARGLCMKHYAYWERRGSPTPLNAPRGVLPAFVAAALLSETDDCLIPPHSKPGRYNSITPDKKSIGAHRYVCEQTHGPAPAPGMHACHSCGNKACCNPRHIRWDTPKGNNADKVKHGTIPRGTRHSNAKLTDDLVRYIRHVETDNCAQLARDIGINRNQIYAIRKGKAWTHVL